MSDIEKRARELLARLQKAKRNEAGHWCDARAAVDAACDTLPQIIAALTPQWQPIETAPRDGTRLLLFGDGDTVVAYFNVGYGTWDDGDHHDDIQGLTHWQPLPAAP